LQEQTTTITAWTDGSCLGNPGPGGWGVAMEIDGRIDEHGGGEPHTTNNRMEMLAAIKALEAAPMGRPIVIKSDSQYLRDGITSWIAGWKRRGWKTASNGVVKNQDLWMKLDALVIQHSGKGSNVSWQWVRGHAGNTMNERVDLIARTEAGNQRR